MKLGKATIYFYDNDCGDEDPLRALEQTLDSREWVAYQVFGYEFVEIGEWYDEIELNNKKKCKIESTYLSYFTENKKAIQSISSAVANILMSSEFTGINFDNAVSMVNEKFKSMHQPYLTLTDSIVDEIKLKSEAILNSWR